MTPSPLRAALRALLGAFAYFSIAIVSPVALVAAPLGLMLALLRPGRRDALFAGLLLGYATWSVGHAAPGFDRAGAAWVCLLGGSTVIALLLWPPGRKPVLTTALGAIGIASLAAVLLVTVTSFSWAELSWLAEHKFGGTIRLVTGMLSQSAQTTPGAGTLSANLEESAASLVRTIGILVPGLILLQSVAALAAAWALYRRLARHPEGEPLPALREFRFSDHLVWGIVLALIALVVPGGQALRELGSNMAAFFGALYVLRGVAVFAALAAAAGVGTVTLVLLALMAAFLAPLAVFTALAMGVMDTWVDWRRRVAVEAPKR